MQVRFGLETQYVYVHINISIPAGWICWVLKNHYEEMDGWK